MEEKEFTSEHILDFDLYKEFTYGYKRNITIAAKIIFYLLIILMIILMTFLKYAKLEVILFATLISIIIAELTIKAIDKVRLQKTYENLVSANKNLKLHNNTTINKEGIIVYNPDSDKKKEIKFEQINSIIETTNVFILKISDNQGVIINKNNLSKGTKDEFIQYMFDKCINLKKKKVYHYKNQIKSWKKYVIGLVLVILISIIRPVIQEKIIKDYLETNGYKITDVTSNYNSSSIDFVLKIEKNTQLENVYIYKLKYETKAMEYFEFMSEWDDEDQKKNEIEQGKIYEDILGNILLVNGEYLLYSDENETKNETINLFEQLNKYL